MLRVEARLVTRVAPTAAMANTVAAAATPTPRPEYPDNPPGDPSAIRNARKPTVKINAIGDADDLPPRSVEVMSFARSKRISFLRSLLGG